MYEASLRADLVDGVLDHSSNSSALNVTYWKPTYYIRGAVRHDPAVAPQISVASIVNGNMTYAQTIPSATGSRIIQGIGIRSDQGRWKSIQSITDPDPWKTRFINATQQVWYVDLLDEGFLPNDIIGGWPKTDKVERATDKNPGDTGLEGVVPDEPAGETITPVNAFSPLWLRSDAPVKPWVVTLDYVPPTTEYDRIYDAKLNYAKDIVPSAGRAFSWVRATDGPPSSTNPADLYYPGNSGRTIFAWEDIFGTYEGSAHFADLRVVTFHQNEYYAINSGVVSGPIRAFDEAGAMTAGFRLATNPFSVFTGPKSNFREGQRFAFLNAPEYVRNPGDMVVSYDRKRIYFIPFLQTNISTGELGNMAQVLNVSMPSAATLNSDQTAKTTFSAPLIIKEKPGFRLNNVTFSTSSGEGLRVERTALQPNQAWDMYLNNCTFTATGTNGLYIAKTPATKVLNCNFKENEGRAYSYWQTATGVPSAQVYDDYRVQAESGNVVRYSSFQKNGRLHPSVPNLSIYHKPSQFWLVNNTFTDLPAIGAHFTGTKTYINTNTFTRVGTDVAEAGVLYTGRTLAGLGVDV